MSVNTSPWDASRLGWLALASFPYFGNRTLYKLNKLFKGDGQAAYNIIPSKLDLFGFQDKTKIKFLKYRNTTNLTDLALNLDKNDLRFITIHDDEFPNKLKEITDPPICLFVRGADIDVNHNTISIVGTRNCTPYGKSTAEIFGREAALAGIGVVSGLALGIDAYAHQAALENSAYCLAVLGSGIDDDAIYPRSNLKLAHDIIKGNGTIISEFPPGTEGLKHHFPLRNRIIAGLSRATLVIEATEQSGSLITAHLALQYNRDVYAIPGPITSNQSKGTNSLIKQGAIPCLKPEDIFEVSCSQAGKILPIRDIKLTSIEKELLEHLPYPRHLDDLCRSINRDIPSVVTTLLDLELKGAVRQQEGKIFEKLI
ncbi:MAG: DNA-processing protein DprA [Patescibacteria group bacterium]